MASTKSELIGSHGYIPISESNVQQYKNLSEEFKTIQAFMNSLQGLRGSIDDERFIEQEREYQKIIDDLGPKLDGLNEIILNEIDQKEKKYTDLKIEIITLKININQEKILFQSGAISKNQYLEMASPFEKKLKELKSQALKIQPSINILKDVIHVANETSPLASKIVHIENEHLNSSSSNSSTVFDKNIADTKGFGKDLRTGCLCFMVAVFGIFIISMII